MAEVAWKSSGVGVPRVVCREAFPALISPPSGYCERGFRSAAGVTGAEIAKKDTSPGTPARGAEFTRGGEELSSQVPALGKCVRPTIKLSGKQAAFTPLLPAGFVGAAVSPSWWGLRAGAGESCVGLSCHGGAVVALFPCIPVAG